MKKFWHYLMKNWTIGKEETDEETARRIIRESSSVVQNCQSAHWEHLCERLSKEMLDSLERIYFDMQEGRLTPEGLPVRLTPVFSTVLLMKRTEQVLQEGEFQARKLKEILAEKEEQAGFAPSVFAASET